MQISALLPLVLALAGGVDAHAPRNMAAISHKHYLEARAMAEHAPAGAIRRSKRDPNVWIKKAKRGGYCKVRGGSAGPQATQPQSAPATAPNAPAAPADGQAAPAPADSPVAAAPAPAPQADATPAPPVDASQPDSSAPPANNMAAVDTNASAGASSGASAGAAGQYTPNGKKAGITSGDNIELFAGKIGWWYDWNATPSTKGPDGVEYVPMIWGNGHLGGEQNDAKRLADWKANILPGNTPYKYAMAFEEPDCSTPGSAAMSTQDTVNAWNELVAPLKAKGKVLLSPSMCKQLAETMLGEIEGQISVPWDITNIHVNKNSVEGIKASIDYYYNKYKKPIWVTEFACVDDVNGFNPCADEGEAMQFARDAVKVFEADPRVHAYAFSNGIGLGGVWNLWASEGLSKVGQAYLDALP